MAGSRASAGSSGPATTSTSCTRTTGWTTRCRPFLDARPALRVEDPLHLSLLESARRTHPQCPTVGHRSSAFSRSSSSSRAPVGRGQCPPPAPPSAPENSTWARFAAGGAGKWRSAAPSQPPGWPTAIDRARRPARRGHLVARAPAGDFIQIDPNNGQPATERTEVRIAFDGDALYLGVTAYDSEPDGIVGNQRRRDETLCSDDKFRWTIDTFLDARTGYFFEMNPEGAMADALIGNTGQNRAWDGVWTAGRGAARSGGRSKSSCRSARSTSIRTATPGASTSSVPSIATTKSASGWDGSATRACSGWRMPG